MIPTALLASALTCPTCGVHCVWLEVTHCRSRFEAPEYSSIKLRTSFPISPTARSTCEPFFHWLVHKILQATPHGLPARPIANCTRSCFDGVCVRRTLSRMSAHSTKIYSRPMNRGQSANKLSYTSSLLIKSRAIPSRSAQLWLYEHCWIWFADTCLQNRLRLSSHRCPTGSIIFESVQCSCKQSSIVASMSVIVCQWGFELTHASFERRQISQSSLSHNMQSYYTPCWPLLRSCLRTRPHVKERVCGFTTTRSRFWHRSKAVDTVFLKRWEKRPDSLDLVLLAGQDIMSACSADNVKFCPSLTGI